MSYMYDPCPGMVRSSDVNAHDTLTLYSLSSMMGVCIYIFCMYIPYLVG